jgi:hypothetical protein
MLKCHKIKKSIQLLNIFYIQYINFLLIYNLNYFDEQILTYI